MALLRVGALPGDALGAAAEFHARILPEVRASGGEDLVLVFEPANYEHRGWRLAVVQQLARDLAPHRVNAIESDDQKAVAAAVDYLETAPGLTGQLLRLDGNGAGALLSQAK